LPQLVKGINKANKILIINKFTALHNHFFISVYFLKIEDAS